MCTIGIFDSGAGGLSVLKELRAHLPKQHFCYYSDNAHCPYGEKSPEYIIDRCHSIVDMLLARGARAVVVACNTATSAAIADLRASYDIPFIGMEPAVKSAARVSRSGVVGVLATAGTLKGSKYLGTRSTVEGSVKVYEHVGRGFVELVENLELNGSHAESVVRESLDPLLQCGADTIVLGCTHYPFLLDTMKKVTAGQDITFIDPAPAVARRLLAVMRENGISECSSYPGTELLSSGSTDTLERLYQLIG